jgi:hypothetical protein
MALKRRYRKRGDALIVAVQLQLETAGFSYLKWGGEQHCKPGDWLVENQGEYYTVDRDTFAQTYSRVGPGVYRKTQGVWAENATEAGTVKTREGSTDYQAGDYLVSNNADGSDSYAIKKSKFEALYEVVDE